VAPDQLYGPPVDPREVALAAEPWAHVLSLALGLGLLAWGWKRSRLTFVTGATICLTAPAFAMIPIATWGHFPTIDKAGSLAFYALGAHWSSWDTTATATQLIGVSMGHLWVTRLFDLVLAPFAAMNAQALLNLVLGWYFAARVAEASGASREASLASGLGFGLGLHALRDINWYTIEKCGQGWLALYALCLLRAHQVGGRWVLGAGLAYGWAFYYNSYWGVLGALLGGVAFMFGSHDARRAVLTSALAGLPFVLVQLPSLANDTLPPPGAFAERAALDVLTLTHWNRIELWRGLDLVALACAGLALARRWASFPRPLTGRRELGAVVVLLVLPTVLAMGPATPLWEVFSALPGMWRFAKPETFLHLAVLAMGVLAAREIDRLRLDARLVLAVQAALWLALARTHSVYPGFSAPG